VGVDALILAVEADGVVRAGEDDALHPMLACCLVDMKHTADVGAEDVFEGMLGGHAAEVNDGVHAFDQGVDRSLVGQVAGDHFFVRPGSRCHRADIGKAQDLGVALQAFAKDLAQAACGSGEQQAFEGGSGHDRLLLLIVVGCRMTSVIIGGAIQCCQ